MSDDCMDSILAEAVGVFRYVEGERPQDRAHAYLLRHRVSRGCDDTAMQRAVEDMAWRAYHVGLSEGLGRDEEPADDGLDTPPWYAGDGVGASEALDSAAEQPAVCERPEKAFYWWALAFKYVWRMWSKADPKNDCAKARDCLARLEKRMGWSE